MENKKCITPRTNGSEQGSAALEMALIFPIMALLLSAVLMLGPYIRPLA